MKKVVAALLAVAVLPALAACNTIEGVGKDVKAGGQAVEDTAVEVKEDITE
ncbi:entericidin ecnab [Hyphomonas hirschiana VP5]|uniref:Entericidin ecnab n=1 Tax=Hyphomonas hirschiana VP5 TaxID=1280951 RepID=A0A059FWG6_9PROT|nr:MULTISPECIES: entericidin A/B family lipoprotein [Hyphomonas]KCZ94947.1 entericidin ecnab [Hyphomonas hirschiana VP5]